MKSDVSEIIGTRAVPLSGGTDRISAEIDMRFCYGYSVMAKTTAGSNGTFKVQGSIDKVSWTDIDSQAMVGAAEFFSNKDAIYWPFIRSTWTNNAGAGTIYAALCIKGS